MSEFKAEQQEWWPEFLEARNNQDLRILSERFGAPISELVLALRRTETPRTPVWTDEARDEAGGRAPEPNDMGPPRRRPGSKDHRIDSIRDQLGSISDRKAAELAGVSQRTITSYRKRHSISAFTGRGAVKGSRRRSRVDPYVDLLGTMPDREIAEKADVTVNAVRNYRQARGIDSYRRNEAQNVSAPREPVSPPPSSQGEMFAWHLGFDDGSVGVVSAPSAGEAVGRAERRGKRVVKLDLVGPVL